MANGSPLRGLESGPDSGPRSTSKDPASWSTVTTGDEPITPSTAVWLTAGEAADAANVAHRQIAAWVASEELSERTGWRGGAEIRLVLLSDLEALADKIHLDRIRGTLAARGVFTGPRHSALGRSKPTRQDGSEASAATPRGTRQVKAEDREWAGELEQEVRRLRRVIQTLRVDYESLERHLETRSTVVATRRLGGMGVRLKPRVGTVQPTAVRAAPTAASPAPSVAAPALSRESVFPKGAIVATVVGLAVGWLGATVASSWGESSDPSAEVGATSGSAVFAAERSDDPGTAAPQGPAPKEAEPSASAALGRADARPADDVDLAAVGSEINEALEGDGSTVDVPLEPRSGTLPPVEVVNPLTLPTHLSPPVALASIDATVFSRRSAVLPDCAYSSFVQAGNGPGDAPGELILGPCFGPARKGDSGQVAVPGTHRVGTVACCRHHAFVERMTSAATDEAALEGLRAEAQAALAEGVLPPLLRIRADRSAGLFLREETRGWESAGLDGMAGQFGSEAGLHEWKRVADQPAGGGVRVTLESWIQPLVRYRPDATARQDEPKVRRFRMTLVVQAAPDGDVLESFQWLLDE